MNKNLQQRNLLGFNNHSPLFTMMWASLKTTLEPNYCFCLRCSFLASNWLFPCYTITFWCSQFSEFHGKIGREKTSLCKCQKLGATPSTGNTVWVNATQKTFVEFSFILLYNFFSLQSPGCSTTSLNVDQYCLNVQDYKYRPFWPNHVIHQAKKVLLH